MPTDTSDAWADAVYLSQKFGRPLSYDLWTQVRSLVDYVVANFAEADLSIWEVRGERQNFLYSKVLFLTICDIDYNTGVIFELILATTPRSCVG